MVKNPPAMQERQVRSLGEEDTWKRKWLPTPVFWPGKFHGQRTWRATVRGVAKSKIRFSNETTILLTGFTCGNLQHLQLLLDSESPEP